MADDDTMILDDGAHVFLWLGSKASDVEIKLALKSAQVRLLCQAKGIVFTYGSLKVMERDPYSH